MIYPASKTFQDIPPVEASHGLLDAKNLGGDLKGEGWLVSSGIMSSCVAAPCCAPGLCRQRRP